MVSIGGNTVNRERGYPLRPRQEDYLRYLLSH